MRVCLRCFGGRGMVHQVSLDELAYQLRDAAEGIEQFAVNIADNLERNSVTLDVWDLPGKAKRLLAAAEAVKKEVERK